MGSRKQTVAGEIRVRKPSKLMVGEAKILFTSATLVLFTRLV